MTGEQRRPAASAGHTPGGVQGDHPDWMAMFEALEDREVDDLLAGVPNADDDLAPVAEVVAAMRRLATREPVPPMSAQLKAQLRGAVVVPIDARRRAGRSLTKAAVAAAVGLVALVGVGASQNRLPADVQDIVSSTAEHLGIDVPSVDDRAGERDDRGGDGGDGREGAEHRGDRADQRDGNADSNSGDKADEHRNDGDRPGAQTGGGHDGATPGGATPAEPGTPGDQQPARPATPPAGSNGTPGQGQGNGTPGRGQGQSNGSTSGGNGQAGSVPAKQGIDNGTGVAGSGAQGAINADPKGMENGTGAPGASRGKG